MIERIDETLAKIEAEQKRLGREVTGDEIPEPTEQELMIFEPQSTVFRSTSNNGRSNWRLSGPDWGSSCRIIRNLASQIEATKVTLKSVKLDAAERWKAGRLASSPENRRNKSEDPEKLKSRRNEMRDLQEFQNEYNSLRGDIEANETDGAVLDERLKSLERGSNIQEQVRIGQIATVPDSPDWTSVEPSRLACSVVRSSW